MLNSEKIRLMTRLTVYEEGLGVKDGRTAEYFRNDYILFGLVGSFVAGSLAWGVCAAVYCGYFFENIFFSVYENSRVFPERLYTFRHGRFVRCRYCCVGDLRSCILRLLF